MIQLLMEVSMKYAVATALLFLAVIGGLSAAATIVVVTAQSAQASDSP
jgi:hypothetical protein